MSSTEKDILDLNINPSYNAFQTLRCPEIKEPRSSKKSNETGRVSWGLPKPSHSMVDVIASALNHRKPSALVKLLDLSTPRFFWGLKPYRELNTFCFYVERSWQHVRVASDDIGLSYHIHSDGLWQLVAADSFYDKGYPRHFTDEHDKAAGGFDLHRCEEDLTKDFLERFPWDPEIHEITEIKCYVTTKEGHHIPIEKLDTIASEKTAARGCPEATKADIEATKKITNELAEIKETLRETLKELGVSASKKRKKAVVESDGGGDDDSDSDSDV